MSASKDKPYHGSCLCGQVKVEITGPITDIIHCHCSKCRKYTGSAYATNGFLATEHFNIVSGSELIKAFSNKAGRSRHFCSECGTPTHSSNADDPSRIRIRIGLIDDEISERPISHNFVTSKANWDEINDDLPHYEAHEPSRFK